MPPRLFAEPSFSESGVPVRFGARSDCDAWGVSSGRVVFVQGRYADFPGSEAVASGQDVENQAAVDSLEWDGVLTQREVCSERRGQRLRTQDLERQVVRVEADRMQNQEKE